ncbi:MAG: NAD(P)/FAD-dependent oxidoreductase [Vulcanococcus sp.]
MAWLLQRQGHAVTLVDPRPGGPQAEGAGSTAALGLLMAQVYRRSSGRGWRLRQQSLQLWQAWRSDLQALGHQLPWRAGLLQLAHTEPELQAQGRLAAERQARGMPLRLLSRDELHALQPALPGAALGGLLSEQDGQLDPLPAMAALRADALRRGLQERGEAAVHLERHAGGPQPWRLQLAGGESLLCDWLVVCAGLASPALLEPLGHHRPQAPVLGQALELQLSPTTADACAWPGSISWDGLNLVPRPGQRLWLGATLEPGSGPADPIAAAAALDHLRSLGGAAPDWLEQATVIRHWQGLRARPEGRPAPLLEQLEPGLLLASGHYRNGVLLAPATAAWAAEQIAAAP